MSLSALEDHLGFWMRSVSNHVSQALASRLLDSGVTVAEWVILREMFGREPVAPSELAESTGLTRGAVSKLAERLVGKKLLERAYAEDDRRYQALALTAVGRALVPKLAAIADRSDEAFFSVLTEKQRRRLFRILKKIAEAHSLRGMTVD